MCTVCTDQKLPDAVNDFDGTSDNGFARLAEYDIQTYTLIMKHKNDSRATSHFEKLGYPLETTTTIILTIRCKPSIPPSSLYSHYHR
jgi:hypothetical protein